MSVSDDASAPAVVPKLVTQAAWLVNAIAFESGVPLAIARPFASLAVTKNGRYALVDLFGLESIESVIDSTVAVRRRPRARTELGFAVVDEAAIVISGGAVHAPPGGVYASVRLCGSVARLSDVPELVGEVNVTLQDELLSSEIGAVSVVPGGIAFPLPS